MPALLCRWPTLSAHAPLCPLHLLLRSTASAHYCCSPTVTWLQPEADEVDIRKAQDLLQDCKQKVRLGRAWPGHVPLAPNLLRLCVSCTACQRLAYIVRSAVPLQIAAIHMSVPLSLIVPQVVAQGVAPEAVATDTLVAVANSAADTGEMRMCCLLQPCLL